MIGEVYNQGTGGGGKNCVISYQIGAGIFKTTTTNTGWEAHCRFGDKYAFIESTSSNNDTIKLGVLDGDTMYSNISISLGTGSGIWWDGNTYLCQMVGINDNTFCTITTRYYSSYYDITTFHYENGTITKVGSYLEPDTTYTYQRGVLYNNGYIYLGVGNSINKYALDSNNVVSSRTNIYAGFTANNGHVVIKKVGTSIIGLSSTAISTNNPSGYISAIVIKNDGTQTNVNITTSMGTYGQTSYFDPEKTEVSVYDNKMYIPLVNINNVSHYFLRVVNVSQNGVYADKYDINVYFTYPATAIYNFGFDNNGIMKVIWRYNTQQKQCYLDVPNNTLTGSTLSTAPSSNNEWIVCGNNSFFEKTSSINVYYYDSGWKKADLTQTTGSIQSGYFYDADNQCALFSAAISPNKYTFKVNQTKNFKTFDYCSVNETFSGNYYVYGQFSGETYIRNMSANSVSTGSDGTPTINGNTYTGAKISSILNN